GDRTIRRGHLRCFRAVETLRQERRSVAQNVVEGRQVVVAYAQFHREAPVDFPTVLKVQVDLIEPAPVVGVGARFGVRLEVTEQNVAHSVSRSKTRGGREGYGTLIIEANILIGPAACYMSAHFQGM